MQRWSVLFVGFAMMACSKVEEPATKEAPATPAPVASAAQKFGAPIDTKGAAVTLGEVAAAPEKFKGQTFVAEGTVGSVCQHRGCWMTLKDENGEAFIRMAGHSFLIPKDAAGKRARVMATLDTSAEEAEPAAGEAACSGGKGHAGCKAEAVEQQGGKPLAKLELQAAGVELL